MILIGICTKYITVLLIILYFILQKNVYYYKLKIKDKYILVKKIYESFEAFNGKLMEFLRVMMVIVKYKIQSEKLVKEVERIKTNQDRV